MTNIRIKGYKSLHTFDQIEVFNNLYITDKLITSCFI